MRNTIITRNNQRVHCWGEWKDNSNCILIFDDADGNEYEEIYADGADSWTHVVEILTALAVERGWTLYELQAC